MKQVDLALGLLHKANINNGLPLTPRPHPYSLINNSIQVHIKILTLINIHTFSSPHSLTHSHGL